MNQNFDTSPNDKKTISPLKFFKARPLFLLTWWVWVHNFIKSKFSLSPAQLPSSLISASPSTRCHGSPNLYPSAKAKKKLKRTIWNQTPKPPNTHTLPLFSVSKCEAVSTLKEWRSLWSDAATGQIGGSDDTGLFLIEKSLKFPLVQSPPVPTRFICDS